MPFLYYLTWKVSLIYDVISSNFLAKHKYHLFLITKLDHRSSSRLMQFCYFGQSAMALYGLSAKSTLIPSSSLVEECGSELFFNIPQGSEDRLFSQLLPVFAVLDKSF